MNSFFYLHYGPGGNSQVEQMWPHFPSNIHFWDQPPCSSYSELVKTTVEKLNPHQHQVNLMAHSFGCNIALTLTQFLQVNELILLSPMASLLTAFKNFGTRILKDNNLDPDYRKKLEQQCSNEQLKGEDLFWDLVHTVTQYSKFQDLYWANDKAKELYLSIVNKTKPMNFEVWKTVLSDYLSVEGTETHKPPSKIKIVLGENDPYVNLKEDLIYWSKKIPTAQILTVPAGHFPHLETSVLEEVLKSSQVR